MYLGSTGIANVETVSTLHRMIEICLKKISSEFGSNTGQRRDATIRLKWLRQHSLFDVSEKILKKRFSPEVAFVKPLKGESELVDHRCAAFIICVIASDVSQIRHLITLALSPKGKFY
jgi:hypothetical protein